MPQLRQLLRSVIQHRIVSITIIFTLALAIGTNTAVFTVASALLLKPLPYFQPHRLMLIDAVHADDGSSYGFTLNRYELYRAQSRSMSGIAAAANESLNLSGAGEPVQIPVARVTGNFFDVLGVRPQLGRTFADGEATPGGRPVIVISDSLWRSRFNADRGVIGRMVNVDARPYTIIGVLPPKMQFPFLGPAEVFSPRYFELQLFSTERLRRGVGYLTAIGRLKDGVSQESAAAEMQLLHKQYSDVNPTAPEAGDAYRVEIGDLQEKTVGNARLKVLILMAAVALVFAIAIANVASLSLARAVARRTEIAVRMALGAGRAQVIKLLLAESVLLAVIAGIVGVALSLAATRFCSASVEEFLPNFRITTDWRVLLFAVVVSVVSGILFGMAPAIRLSRTNLNETLRAEGTGASASGAHSRSREVLVIAQAALSLILLVAAGLLLRSFEKLLHESSGFNEKNLLVMNIGLPTSKYPNASKQVAFFNELLRSVSNLGEVRSAAISSATPLTTVRVTPMLPEGQAEVPLPQRPFIDIEMVSPHWFETAGVALRQGRDFTQADDVNAPSVVVVNQAFAKRYWPEGNWMGKHITIGRLKPSEVIGVSADARNNGLANAAQPQVYIPYAQLSWSNMNLLVRTRVKPQSAIASIKHQMELLDPEQPVASIKTGEELIAGSQSQMRFTTLLMASFSAIGVILCAVGLYSVLAYSVARRRRELAIRLAIGASQGDLFRAVVLRGVALAAVGMVIGIAIAAAASRAVTSMLYKVQAIDVKTFALAPLFLLVIAVLATSLAALRALRINPLEALKS